MDEVVFHRFMLAGWEFSHIRKIFCRSKRQNICQRWSGIRWLTRHFFYVAACLQLGLQLKKRENELRVFFRRNSSFADLKEAICKEGVCAPALKFVNGRREQSASIIQTAGFDKIIKPPKKRRKISAGNIVKTSNQTLAFQPKPILQSFARLAKILKWLR